MIGFNTGNPFAFYSVSRMGIDGTGAVSTVCGVAPNSTGNVDLSASDVGALASSGGEVTKKIVVNGTIDMRAHRITSLADPVAVDDAVH